MGVRDASVTLLILINVTNLPGRLLPPLLSDRRLGPVNTIIPCIFMTAIFLFVWIGATSHTAITVVACFYGFFSGAVQGLYNPAIWNFPGDNVAKKGVRVAFVFLWSSGLYIIRVQDPRDRSFSRVIRSNLTGSLTITPSSIEALQNSLTAFEGLISSEILTIVSADERKALSIE